MSQPADDPKQWSYQWFAARSDEARAEMATWPQWMRAAAHWRTTPPLQDLVIPMYAPSDPNRPGQAVAIGVPRETAKPRLSKIPGGWTCECDRLGGIGVTPESAYRAWKRRADFPLR